MGGEKEIGRYVDKEIQRLVAGADHEGFLGVGEGLAELGAEVALPEEPGGAQEGGADGELQDVLPGPFSLLVSHGDETPDRPGYYI